ncbi:uncharacterized protein LOC135135172 isoform X2 [Zophobas morio]|uniref:uncharacterized protein LOC135135172 isoform X2 n=1 Tax=Zophobas morio TaxID=2755281 RepID=UPI003083DCC0
MFYHVLIYVTAFIIIGQWFKTEARTFLQGPTFCRNLKKKSEVTPIKIQDSISNVGKAFQTSNKENPGGKLFRGDDSLFVNKFFGSGYNHKRQKRSFKEAEENSLLDEDPENNEETPEDVVRQDEDFQRQQMMASNLTNSSKVLYEELENPETKNSESGAVCVNEDEKNYVSKAGTSGVKQVSFNGRAASNNFLEMHFYKPQPERENLKIIPGDKKSLVINLYEQGSKSKKEIQTSEKYDYIELLSKESKLVQVPAVRFTVVPGESTNRRRRKDRFVPFYTSRYGPYP